MHRLINPDNIHQASLTSCIFFKKDDALSLCGIEFKKNDIVIHLMSDSIIIPKEDIIKVKIYSVEFINQLD